MLAKNEHSGNQKPKKIIDTAYRLNLRRKLFCPRCKLLCICRCTNYDSKGGKIQYRYCPECNHPVQIRLKKSRAKQA